MTPALLKEAVLERIGVVPAGGPYPSDEVALITTKYTGVYAILRHKKLATWAITENIPAEAQLALVAMLAFAAAAEYGVPEPRYSRLRLEGSLDDEQPSLAERQLRKALSGTPTPAYAQRSEYY
jgi:hypothetical protein